MRPEEEEVFAGSVGIYPKSTPTNPAVRSVELFLGELHSAQMQLRGLRMAGVKLGEAFGMDISGLSDGDWALAIERIIHDMRSDFIFAPHIGFIYRNAANDVIEIVKRELKDGKYMPGLPLTMEVPKSYRIRVNVNPPRLGPAYSRPGSILMPKDRLLYQILADQAAPIIDAKTDHSRSFSHRLEGGNSPTMFKPTRHCWAALQAALTEQSNNPNVRYVLKLDVANFFGSLNQHTLVNVLSDAGYPAKYLTRLEAMLTAYTGERSSRGILQGIYPSDLLGNFYMEPIDRLLADQEIPSARYVDDMYIFLPSVDAAEKLIWELIPELRRYDLGLNEAKSVIMPKNSLNTEEPDLEKLFDEAVAEISEQVDEDDFDADYGFQSEWEEEEEEEEEDDDLELKATKVLFDALSEYPGHEENIERFCLPLFSKASSTYAVDHVLDAFKKRPSMSQIYASYLAKFLEQEDVYTFLTASLEDRSLVDWQRMWILAALMPRKPNDDGPVKSALQIVKDGTSHEALRAAAAIYVGRHGDMARRNALAGTYPTVSAYVQSAIYFASRYWVGPEKANARAKWGGLNQLNELLTKAMAKK